MGGIPLWGFDYQIHSLVLDSTNNMRLKLCILLLLYPCLIESLNNSSIQKCCPDGQVRKLLLGSGSTIYGYPNNQCTTNTEYSAEYSVKNGRIFGTVYSAKSADTPITENCAKKAIFDLTQFHVIFGTIWSKFLKDIDRYFSPFNFIGENISFFIVEV